MRATAILALGTAAMLAWPAELARAEPAQILFEARAASGQDRSETSAALARLREELRRREVTTSPRAIAELPNELLPLAGVWDLELSLAELTAQLDTGVRSYLRGQFTLAAEQLGAALALARRNPALVVSDPSSPRWMTQAMVSLALTRQRMRQRAAAWAAMAEQVRSFPELAVTRADFGSRGEALYREVRAALEAGPRGSLLVDVSDPDARIYVNEHGRGRGGAFSSDLLPGAYRVLVMVGTRSRMYRVVVHANEQTRLAVDWAADLRFEVSPAWVGLRDPQRGGSVGEHQRLARRLAFNDAIVVGVSGGERGAGGRIWGAVYERGSGRPLRRGEIEEAALAGAAMGGEQGDPLPRFAEFLRSGRYSREFGVGGGELTAEAAELGGPAVAVPRNPRPPGAIAFGAIGVVAIGGGTYFALRASRDPCPGCDGDRSSRWAIAMISGGVVSLGVATFLVFEARRGVPLRGRTALGLQPLLRGGIATLGWQF